MNSSTDSNLQKEQELSEVHYRVLLCQLLRQQNLTELATKTLVAEHLKSAGASVAQAVIYSRIKEYFDTNKNAPDYAALTADVGSFIREYLSDRPEVEEQINGELQLLQLMQPLVDERSEAMARNVIKAVAEKCILNPAMEDLLQNAIAQKVVSGLGQQICDIEARRASMTGGRAENNVLSAKVLETGDRVTTGISWLDAYLGNGKGPVLGSLMTIVAGMGSGKTAFGIQLGVAQALQERHVLIALAEEGRSKTFTRRLQSCTLGVPTTVIEENNDDLDKVIALSAEPEALKVRRAVVDRYLHVLDLVNNDGGLQSIISEIETMKLMGKQLTYVYVDWCDPIATKLLQDSSEFGIEFSGITQAIQFVSDTLALTASRNNLIIALSQQLAGANYQKGPTHPNDHYSAADCKMFSKMAKYAFVINPPSLDKASKGISLFIIAKARDESTMGSRFAIKLKGEISQFFDVSKEFEPQGRKIRPKGAPPPKPGIVPGNQGP